MINTNENFAKLEQLLRSMGAKAAEMPQANADYQRFSEKFPAGQLTELSLDQYCVGKQSRDSFCWWLERGLEDVLGRYMPGTSRGHVLYFLKDGSLYKHRHLQELSDADALQYVLRIHAALALANPEEVLGWVDDDAQIYQRAGVPPRVTMGDGRKLRMLAAFHPDAVLPISSSDHVAHFLKVLGCLPADIPPANQPVARMLLLRRYYEEASQTCQGLTPLGFVHGLYADGLGLAPLRDVDDVLRHFGALPGLAEGLRVHGQLDAFCQLAMALHEAGLDWWVTQAQLIHAGRTDDPKVWQTAVALELELHSDGLQVRLDDAGWQKLDADVAAKAIDAAQAGDRIPALTGRSACWPDDYDGSDISLTVLLTGGAVRNGYIKVPKLQALFPARCIAPDEKTPAAQQFSLTLPNGETISTAVLANRGRIQARFGALFSHSGVQEGDRAFITKEGESAYRLSFSEARLGAPAVQPPLIPSSILEPEKSTMNTVPLNQILFGPPGTGKTYSTVTKALEILDPQLLAQITADVALEYDEKRERLKQRFDELLYEEKRIRFTTFHQSFSYEDFVEGIRATVEDGAEGSMPRYKIEKGVFAQLCETALQNREQDQQLGVREGAVVWKISIGEVNGASDTRDYCFANNEIRVGWPQAGDLSTEEYLNNPAFSAHNRNALWAFSEGAQIGDIVLCFAGNSCVSGVGVVSGDYRHEPQVPGPVRKDFVQVRPVRWLLKNIDFSVKELNGNKALVQQTMYELHRISWPRLQEALLAKGYVLSGLEAQPNASPLPYVLVIDEINRGNVSRIFGELITLLEPSKRAGAAEALSATLPYSKQSFSVPGNVYIIGTMNTTDRSLAGLDVALRRRFVFEELMPDPSALKGVTVSKTGVSVDIAQLLQVMNERIEALLDREHQLGHAYFMPLRETDTLEKLAQIFKNQILPLLQEYFFDDWERIAWVLNDHRKPQALRFVQKHGKSLDALFGSSHGVQAVDTRWRINPDAFNSLASFAGVISAPEQGAEQVGDTN